MIKNFVGKFFSTICEDLLRDTETANPVRKDGCRNCDSFFIFNNADFRIFGKCVCDTQDVRFTIGSL